MSHQSRRSFLKKMLAGAATITIAGTKSSGAVLGANDTIRVGVAGIHARGRMHVNCFSQMKGVQVAYLIDPDTRTFGPVVQKLLESGRKKPQTIQDFRKALDDKSLDALAIATPNHWHTPMTIWACKAGKHVYVEKPASHNFHEGRLAVEAARKYNRIVAHGTGCRSEANWPKLAALIASGKYGKLLVSHGICYKPRKSIGMKSPKQSPAQVDFDLWLGPAQKEPYHENLVHYNWHWFWKFGNGEIGNQGAHQMDVARWMIPGATLPRSVISLGGRFGYVDQGQTPNTQMAVYDFGETQLVFEVRGLQTDSFMGCKIGNICYLEAGKFFCGEDGDVMFQEKGKDKAVLLPGFVNVKAEAGYRLKRNMAHFKNFIAGVRSGKPADTKADILEGHYTCALSHLANISYRLGKEVPFDPKANAFGNNKDANETLARMEAHLTANGLKLANLKYRLGRKLEIDAKAERIKNDEEANKLMSGQYRKDFDPMKI